MKYEGRPEPLLAKCAARIEREADPMHRTELEVIAQVMTQLRFPGSALINLFEGVPKMIESPLIEKWKAEAVHEMILDTLKRRFDSTPREITKPLRRIFKEKKHKHLNWIAFNCDNLDEFAEAVKLVPPDPKV